MSLDFVAETWEVLRIHIDSNDRKDAADELINLLIDNNYEPDEIKESFKGDKDINKALKYYAEQHDALDNEDEDSEDDDVYEDEW